MYRVCGELEYTFFLAKLIFFLPHGFSHEKYLSDTRRYIAMSTSQVVRFVGLSTALANARDLADWLGIQEQGLFNFKPSVRPVPLEVHIQV